ncbi:putative bifunctional diguanylate cyclase/phosphodiesterase [Solimonas flava]|uniref:putative bifunctional diguanylate cyclase/phosphodiesterase n=1 Tax=Solimonas flava TaxID=415849 RepID=UPI000416E3A0|nr:EAL domain-containing protein [Solimonas flava]
MTAETHDKNRARSTDTAGLGQADLQRLFDALPEAKLIVDRHGQITMINRRLSELFGYPAAELCGQSITQLIPPRSQAEALQRLERFMNERGADPNDRVVESVGLHRDGHEIPTEIQFSRLQLGTKRYAVISACDLARSQSHASALKLRKACALRQAMLDTLPFSAIATNKHGLITGCNLAAQRLLGYDNQELLGHSYLMLLAPDDLARRSAELAAHTDAPPTGFDIVTAHPEHGAWTYVRKNGSTLQVNIGVAAIHGRDGDLIGYLHMADDGSERQRSEAFIRQMASRDPLTGLANRTLLMERLDGAIRQAKRHRRQLAVLMLDLDRFKHINDTLGHAAGDHLLVAIARRLAGGVRDTDTVGRLGGDEFVLVLNEVEGRDALDPMLAELVRTVSTPLMIDGSQVQVTPSIGAALFPEDGESAALLLRHADAAMFRAKHLGRAGAQWFRPAMLQPSQRHESLRDELQRAIDGHQLRLHYLPEISLGALHAEGMEALLRWQHPQRGLLMPESFIDCIEDCQLSLPLLQWVIDTACREAATLRKAMQRPLRLTLNLSARQLHHHALPALVRQALHGSDLPAAALTLEVSESSLLQNPEASAAVLQKLRACGVTLGIDDFGTGPTSLSMLTRLGVDHVKIDRSFVRAMADDRDAHRMVDAIIALGYSTGVHVTAKGVETMRQQRMLQERGCHHAQGFLYGEAVPAADFAALVARLEQAG